MGITSIIHDLFTGWLAVERPPSKFPVCDFQRIRYEVRPCDVLLIEGRARVSEVIKMITQSSWSHAALYIGRLHDIEDPALREQAALSANHDPDVQLLVEGVMGKGTVITPLHAYRDDHIRICRPRGLTPDDAQVVVQFAIDKLGTHYDVRQIIDLARFLFPWTILPRRWRSRLFSQGAGESTHTICSTMLAEAFASIDFPILPHVTSHAKKGIQLIPRNPRLFTPRDFDYSPYFDVIKYPFVGFEQAPYRNLPWNREGLVSHDHEHISRKTVSEVWETPAFTTVEQTASAMADVHPARVCEWQAPEFKIIEQMTTSESDSTKAEIDTAKKRFGILPKKKN